MSQCFKVLEDEDILERLTKISSFDAISRLTDEQDYYKIIDLASRQSASAISEKISNLDVSSITITGVDYSIANSEVSLTKQGSQGYSAYHGEKAITPDAELKEQANSALSRIKSLWERLGANYTVYEEIPFTEGESFYPDGIYVSFEYGAYTGYQDMSGICEYSRGLKIGDEVTLEMDGMEVSVYFLEETIGQFTMSVTAKEATGS